MKFADRVKKLKDFVDRKRKVSLLEIAVDQEVEPTYAKRILKVFRWKFKGSYNYDEKTYTLSKVNHSHGSDRKQERGSDV